MNNTSSDTRRHGGTTVAPESTPAVRRKLSTTATEFMAERQGLRPEWIRAPKGGHEFHSSQSRAKLYEWAGKGYIRSVSIREPGQVKGVRLFHLQSILDFIARCEAQANADAGKAGAK